MNAERQTRSARAEWAIGQAKPVDHCSEELGLAAVEGRRHAREPGWCTGRSTTAPGRIDELNPGASPSPRLESAWLMVCRRVDPARSSGIRPVTFRPVVRLDLCRNQWPTVFSLTAMHVGANVGLGPGKSGRGPRVFKWQAQTSSHVDAWHSRVASGSPRCTGRRWNRARDNLTDPGDCGRSPASVEH